MTAQIHDMITIMKVMIMQGVHHVESVSIFGIFSGPCFLVIGPNTEVYRVNLRI